MAHGGRRPGGPRRAPLSHEPLTINNRLINSLITYHRYYVFPKNKIPFIGNNQSCLVSWLLSFLVCWCLGFQKTKFLPLEITIVYGFLGFLVSSFYYQIVIPCSLVDIDIISEIQIFFRQVFIIFRVAFSHFPNVVIS